MRLLTFLSLFFFMAASQADVVFSPGLSYYKSEVDNNGSTSERERRSLDFRLGYIHQSGLYLGAMYAMTAVDDDDMYGVGPTLGFSHQSGFYALFTYFVTAEYKYNSGGKLTDGMGPQIDFGWVFPLTNSVYIGPQITYRSVGYDKSESGGSSTTTDVTHKDIAPYLTFWFRF